MLKNVPVWTFLTLPVYVPVAQLDRASDSDSEGRAFESHQVHQKKTSEDVFLFYFTLQAVLHYIKTCAIL